MFDWLIGKKKKFGEEYLKCPRCRINMDKIEQNGVIIDICRKCKGMWIDDGEIEKIVRQIKSQTNRAETTKIKKTRTKQALR